MSDRLLHITRSFALELGLTNFALSTLLSADEHTTMTVGHQAASEEPSSKSLPGLHGLHSQIGAHGLWYRVKVLARL